MQTEHAIEIPSQVLDYLDLHHIITIGTSSFTGVPHAATTAYVSNDRGLYFAMRPEELTLRNIEANHWASFTIDDYTPQFRKVRELRGVGRCGTVTDAGEQDAALDAFATKLPGIPPESLTDLQRITPLVLDFVDLEYTEGVAVPRESSVVFRAAPEAAGIMSAGIATRLEQRSVEAGEVIVRQGEVSDRFFIIVDGEVEVRREGHGQDVTVTRYGPGQLFGEVGALTGSAQAATFVAVTPATVMAVDRSAFQEVVAQSARADLGQRVKDAIADRSRPEATSPPEGWYPDPIDPDLQRYWDGARWTQHTRGRG